MVLEEWTKKICISRKLFYKAKECIAKDEFLTAIKKLVETTFLLHDCLLALNENMGLNFKASRISIRINLLEEDLLRIYDMQKKGIELTLIDKEVLRREINFVEEAFKN